MTKNEAQGYGGTVAKALQRPAHIFSGKMRDIKS